MTELKLTPEMQERIVRALGHGVDVRCACSVEGISRATYYAWRRRGEQGEEPYVSFLEATDRARAKLEAAVTATIVRAAVELGDHRAGLWWLDWRANHGRQRIEIAGPVQALPLTDEAADELRARILYGAPSDEPL